MQSNLTGKRKNDNAVHILRLYCSLWPNRTARSLSRTWPSLLRAHNHIGGATAVPLHHKKCLLCSVLIYMVVACMLVGFRQLAKRSTGNKFDFDHNVCAIDLYPYVLPRLCHIFCLINFDLSVGSNTICPIYAGLDA